MLWKLGKELSLLRMGIEMLDRLCQTNGIPESSIDKILVQKHKWTKLKTVSLTLLEQK